MEDTTDLPADGEGDGLTALIENALASIMTVEEVPALLSAASRIILHAAAILAENARLAPGMTDLALDLNEISNTLRRTLPLP